MDGDHSLEQPVISDGALWKTLARDFPVIPFQMPQPRGAWTTMAECSSRPHAGARNVTPRYLGRLTLSGLCLAQLEAWPGLRMHP